MEILFFIAEIIGTAAFAVSGTLTAVEKRLDIFGALVVGTLTAVGGGIARDIIIGVIPPTAFTRPVYAITAAITAVILFFFLKFVGHRIVLKRETLDTIINIIDAAGLAAFVIVGVDTAVQHGYSNGFFIVFLGTMTGIGGGMLRDILVSEIPMVLYKRIYAIAAILGSMVYYYLSVFGCPGYISIPLCFILIITLRVLAAKYRWHLPKIT